MNTSHQAMHVYEEVFRSEDAAVPVVIPPKPSMKLSKSKNKSG